MKTMEDEIVAFITKWGPPGPSKQMAQFIDELRCILETYGRNAIIHGDLPDTDHPHRGSESI